MSSSGYGMGGCKGHHGWTGGSAWVVVWWTAVALGGCCGSSKPSSSNSAPTAPPMTEVAPAPRSKWPTCQTTLALDPGPAALSLLAHLKAAPPNAPGSEVFFGTQKARLPMLHDTKLFDEAGSDGAGLLLCKVSPEGGEALAAPTRSTRSSEARASSTRRC
jgi:hypothetical protein